MVPRDCSAPGKRLAYAVAGRLEPLVRVRSRLTWRPALPGDKLHKIAALLENPEPDAIYAGS